MGLRLVFLDTETTGLHPDLHEIWEVAAIVREEGQEDEEYVWQLQVERLDTADSKALEINRFLERRLAYSKERDFIPVAEFAQEFMVLTWGARLVGSNPAFDADRLDRLMRAATFTPQWHHRLIDIVSQVEGVAAGLHIAGVEIGSIVSNAEPEGFWSTVQGDYESVKDHSWVSSSEFVKTITGVTVDPEVRHTALGDARWVRDTYDWIYGEPR